MRFGYDTDDLDQRNLAFIAWGSRYLEPLIERYFRAQVRGLERIPRGAGLYVGNHNAGLVAPEMYILGAAAFRAHGVEGLPYGLGHEIVFKLPVVNQLFVPLGAVRASHEVAARIFARGRKALVFPGGDVDTFRPYRERNTIRFGGRRGYVRLALRSGVPVLPVVTAGAHGAFVVVHDMPGLAKLLRADKLFRCKVWPLSLSIPWGLWLGPTPPFLPLPRRVILEILEPIRFERSGEAAAADDDYVAACAAEVEARMQAALTGLAAELEDED